MLITVSSYMDIVNTCALKLISICGLYVAFQAHITFWHVDDNRMFPVMMLMVLFITPLHLSC